jgi:hypothetical protein
MWYTYTAAAAASSSSKQQQQQQHAAACSSSSIKFVAAASKELAWKLAWIRTIFLVDRIYDRNGMIVQNCLRVVEQPHRTAGTRGYAC